MRIQLDPPLSALEISRAAHIPPFTSSEKLFPAIATDSRLVKPGDLFVPLSGGMDDGHRYIKEATARGAGTCLSERDIARTVRVGSTLSVLSEIGANRLRARGIPVIAITGSVGKTGTKDAIATVLATKYLTHKTEDNQNNSLGLAYTLLSCPPTAAALVLEFGTNHKGEIAALAKTAPPDIAVITAIGSSHIGAFGTKEEILAEKASIISSKSGAHLIVNGDDPLLRTVSTAATVSTVGTMTGCHLKAEDIRMSQHNTSYNLRTEAGSYRVLLQGAGMPRIYSSLFALEVAAKLNIPLSDAINALGDMRYPGGRQSIVDANGILLIDDAYNASPEAVAEALSLLSLLGTCRERHAVLGDMLELGKMAEALHKEIGHLTAEKATHLYAFGQYAACYVQGATEAGMPKERILAFADADAAANALPSLIPIGSAVLVKASHALHGDRIVAALKKKGNA